MDLEQKEREKYNKMWNVQAYRRTSPAERQKKSVLDWLNRHACSTVVDFGCGTGRLDLALSQEGYSVRMLDIADNCLDDQVRQNLGPGLTFETACLWSEEVSRIRADAVICLDVLEHIPTDKVDAVVENIRNAAPHGYCNAALYHDGFGKRINDTLHLTVKPAGWWHEKFPNTHWSVRGNDAWMVW